VIKNNKEFSYTESIVFMILGLSILYSIKFHEFTKAIAIPYSTYSNKRIKDKKVLELIGKLAPAEIFLLSSGRTSMSSSQKNILTFIQHHVSFYLSESEMTFISSLPDIVNLLNTKISKLVKIIPIETIIEIQNKVKQNAH
jgi:thiaminase